MFAEVAFPIRSFQTFTYSIPQKHISNIYIGTRVAVPLRQKIIYGIVVDIKKSHSYSGSLKQIIEPVDKIEIITPPLWELIKWVGKYYMSPIGKVANSVMPKSLSINYRPSKQKYVTIKRKIGSIKLIELKKRAPKQYLVYKIISTGNKLHNLLSLKNIVSNPLQICISLQNKGLVTIVEKEKVPTIDENIFDPIYKNIVFNKDQKSVVDKIIASLKESCFNSFLLHGVTGSGKTEIYIGAVQHCLKQNRNAIILLPEISLTPQIAGRFRAVFGDIVAIWHSKLKANHRSWTWKKICKGDFKIVIGARSGIFTPLKNVGLIIVDEEQETSFYQDMKEPRYHARDVALMRGHFEKGTVVVSSATPSLESYYNFQQKRSNTYIYPNVMVMQNNHLFISLICYLTKKRQESLALLFLVYYKIRLRKGSKKTNKLFCYKIVEAFHQ